MNRNVMVYLSNRTNFKSHASCTAYPGDCICYPNPLNQRMPQIIIINRVLIHLYRQSCIHPLSGELLYAYMRRYAMAFCQYVRVSPCIRTKVTTLWHCIVRASLPVTALLVDLCSPPLEVFHQA